MDKQKVRMAEWFKEFLNKYNGNKNIGIGTKMICTCGHFQGEKDKGSFENHDSECDIVVFLDDLNEFLLTKAEDESVKENKYG